ncbi:hypothetical protein [Nocardiopsis dassonvillei]|uniref:hypothetical protein n=1 Tax=Nocardiopsis dassonvillei TaxID=2014 RepID=UPI000B9D56FA|nr:hypothetical protein [Nocardiopsis dassonvillei]ASU61435.1 hypothetical protein CGQ36_24885 [Nocardiopsis dassonvillei]
MGRAARGRSAHPGLAWVRMLLLVSVLLGVAGMHTLGHASTGAEHASPVSTASVVAHADPVPEAHTASATGAYAAPGAGAHAAPVTDAHAAPAAHAASAAGAHAAPVPEAHAVAGGYSVPNTHDAAGGYSDPDAHAASPVTDPTTMCLAVAALVASLVGLAAAVFLPWPGPLPRPPSSPLRRAVRVAPPEPPCLAKLQVLRV